MSAGKPIPAQDLPLASATQAGGVKLSGTGTDILHGDGTWSAGGSGVTDHGLLTGLADDDHTQYQLRSEAGAANGYATLGASSKVVQDPQTARTVPIANGIPKADAGTGLIALGWLGSGTPDATKFLRGDATWQAVAGVQTVDVTVDFGAAFTHFAQAVVTGLTWIGASSKLAVTPKAAAGQVEETALMQFSSAVSDLVAGTGFTLSVYTPIEAKGTYTFSCVGI